MVGGGVVAGFERGESIGQDIEVGKVVGGEPLSLEDREVDIWLSQDACTGRWIMVALGNASVSCAAAVQPRCDAPFDDKKHPPR
jgi:hypothetical protein